MHESRDSAGFSLIEIVIAMALIGIMAGIGAVSFGNWMGMQRVRSSARELADAFMLARTEAMRTGNNHVVFFSVPNINDKDPVGNDILDQQGIPVVVLVINDGPQAASNCQIDPNEELLHVRPTTGLRWGIATAPVRAPLDTTIPPIADGLTFSDPTNPATPVNWVLFQPDGIPVNFEGDPVLGCGTIGSLGSGRGAAYITDGTRDYAVVLSPLGGVDVNAWDPDNARWSD